jgi:hypothetical protein
VLTPAGVGFPFRKQLDELGGNRHNQKGFPYGLVFLIELGGGNIMFVDIMVAIVVVCLLLTVFLVWKQKSKTAATIAFVIATVAGLLAFVVDFTTQHMA